MSPFDLVAARLDERGLVARRHEMRLSARCPVHHDRNPSLSVSVGDNEQALVHCYAGCETADVLDALGLEFRDLYAGACPKPWTNNGLRRTGASFEPDGRVRLGAVRYTAGASNGTPKTLAAKGTRRDLWPAPDTIEGEILLVVEGEPDAVTGASLNLPTVAVPGVGKWQPEWAQRIAAGRDRVVVIADSDKPGREAAQRTAATIVEHCSDVRVLDLAPSRDDGYDLSDYASDTRDDDERRQARELLLKAVELTKPLAAGPPNGSFSGLRIVRASDVRVDAVRFLLDDRVPIGAVSMVAGDPGLGKSTWTCGLAAGVTAGRYGAAGTVLIANAEDSRGHVIVPRLAAASADLDRVEFFTIADGVSDRAFELPGDVAHLEAHARKVCARLVVIDPLNAHLSDAVSSRSDHSVRRALAPLAAMAQRLGIAVVVVAHLNKAQGTDAIYRVGGSIGLVGGARSLLVFTRDPNDPDGEEGTRRALGHVKSNWARLAKTLTYAHEEVTVTVGGTTVMTNKLVERGESDVAGTALLSADPDDSPARKLDRAGELIADMLGDGKRRRASELKQAASTQGIPERTIQRAAHDAGVVVESEGFPRRTYWRLDSGATSRGTTVVGATGATVKSPASTRDVSFAAPQSRQTNVYGATNDDGLDEHDSEQPPEDASQGAPAPVVPAREAAAAVLSPLRQTCGACGSSPADVNGEKVCSGCVAPACSGPLPGTEDAP